MRRGMRNVLGASTAVLCLGGLLAACGSEDGDGYVATGPAAASPERAPGKGVAPTGDVELVPLDGSGKPADAKGDGGGSDSAEPGSDGSDGKSPGGKAGSGSSDTPVGGDPSTDAAKPGRTAGSSDGGTGGSGGSSGGSSGGGSTGPSEGGASGTPSAPGGGTSTQPSGPAKLGVGEPRREPAADRWCEKVTASFRNTGGSPVRSGTVTFGTHVIGALGVDWATIESTQKLPAPIDAGKTVKKTWTVCVEAWRVPLGMHVETRDVSVKWK
ncbi:hypothetical protein [Streptomyces sp. NPDC058268]|uniref:hypothetical protein n=1 Tax=Streptomyces sp. NPDC058268 TaxID=3346413 RepID=UPI0036E97387